MKYIFFFALTVSVYFFARLVKTLLKWLQICLALVINGLSIRRLETD